MTNDLNSNDSPITVMIVEDHLVFRFGLKVVIESDPGFKVVTEAGDGERAVVLAQEFEPDVILMDVSLPGLDGIAATKQIKSLLLKSKVLMLTSHDGDDQLFSALSAGADGYCLKDISTQSICRAIRSVNSGACWLDPVVAKKVIKAYTGPKFAKPNAAISR